MNSGGTPYFFDPERSAPACFAGHRERPSGNWAVVTLHPPGSALSLSRIWGSPDALPMRDSLRRHSAGARLIASRAPSWPAGPNGEKPMARELTGRSRSAPAARLLALALGAAACGALAIGALAIGRIAVGRLTIKKARFGAIEVDELTVRKLRVVEEERPSS